MKLVQAVALMAKVSRREASELIKKGLVTLNGQLAENYSQEINPNSDKVKIRNQKPNKKLLTVKKYFAFYKPRGVISTLAKQSNTIREVVEKINIPNLKPIGRLDAESEGLMILTNDGELINKLSHPSSHIEKVYSVTISGLKKDQQLEHLSKFLKINSNERFKNKIVLEVTLHEGQNRQIRRACAQAGLYVERILRIAIGNVKLNNIHPRLKVGEWKELTSKPFFEDFNARQRNPRVT
ncbi:MAG: pseudouridine synthase [Candidatus Caenarcaniphilales bacterium]|nr:pseudouridine synthase [Candidatus Caenarcaniphilales bacterium]